MRLIFTCEKDILGTGDPAANGRTQPLPLPTENVFKSSQTGLSSSFYGAIGGVTAEELQRPRTQHQVQNESGDALEPWASSTVSAITVKEPPSILTSSFRRSHRVEAPIQFPIPNEAPRFSNIRHQALRPPSPTPKMLPNKRRSIPRISG